MKVAINGFGRIGRLAFRRIQDVPGIDVVAINDLTDNKMLAHLLKYDSTQGRFNGTVDYTDDKFIVNGKEIKTFELANPAELPWGQLGVDVSETIVSGASCTTNCLAPMAKVLNDKFGVIQGIMTTIHAYTGDQNTLDAPHRKGDLRRARAAAENIVPNSTGAAKAIGLVIPELKGKLDGAAQRIPVPTGSVTELVTVLSKPVTVAEINEAMKAAANESFGYTEDEIVSSDVIGITEGSLFDATQTKIVDVDGKQLVKTVAWYDNEMSYTCQLVRTLQLLGK